MTMNVISILIFIALCFVFGIPVYMIYSHIISTKRAAKFGFSDKYINIYKTTREKIIDLIVWFGSGFLTILLIFIIFIHYSIGIGIWKGHTPKIYEKATTHSNGYISLPPNPKDLKVYGENWLKGAHSAAAFSLHGDDYDEFITAIEKRFKIHIDEASRSENDFTGKTVDKLIDYYNDDEKYLGLRPNSTDIKYVLYDDIRNYTVLYYYFTKNETHLIATNPNTGRFIIYNGGYD